MLNNPNTHFKELQPTKIELVTVRNGLFLLLSNLIYFTKDPFLKLKDFGDMDLISKTLSPL